MKERVNCAVRDVVTNLRNDSSGFEPFFPKAKYSGLQISLPRGYKFPFAVFMDDGSLHLLWAETLREFNSWTEAFKEIKGLKQRNSQSTVPFPEITDENNFVANLYCSLVTNDLNKMSFDQLESHRESR